MNRTRVDVRARIKIRAVAAIAGDVLFSGKVLRNQNNGFDGVIIALERATGKLKVYIQESKCWAALTRPCESADMTAIGLGAAPQTYQQNVDALFLTLQSLSPNPLSALQLDELRLLLADGRFTFVLHTLHESRFNPDLPAAVLARFPNSQFSEIEGW